MRGRLLHESVPGTYHELIVRVYALSLLILRRISNHHLLGWGVVRMVGRVERIGLHTVEVVWNSGIFVHRLNHFFLLKFRVHLHYWFSDNQRFRHFGALEKVEFFVVL